MSIGRSRLTRTTLHAHVQYYIDADMLGRGKLLVQVRTTSPTRAIQAAFCTIVGVSPAPSCLRPCRTSNGSRSWTANHWLIITRDANIAVNRAEIAAVRDNAARMVTLSGRDAIGTWNQIEILMTQWRQIQSFLDQPGPFIYAATRTSIRAVDLT